MSVPLVNADLEAIERRATISATAASDDTLCLLAEVRGLRDGIRSIVGAWDRWWPDGPASLAAAHFRTLLGDDDD